MKQKTAFLTRAAMLLVVLFSLAGARADELTLYDGTDTNNTIPAYIYFFDEYTRSQFVIPADDLADMDIGVPIEALKFYANQAYPASDKTPAPVDVYLKKVDYTNMEGMEGYEPKDDCTIVYQGTLSTGEDNVMTIAFTEPYTYLGGNLLIGIDNTTDEGDWQNVSFYGLSVDNVPAISSHNGSSADNIKPTKRRFIPKTTIIYTPLPVQSLPYYEDFYYEDFGEGIGLWTMWNCEEGSGIYENSGEDGSKCFGFKWSTNPPQYLSSPKFDGTSAMKVSFKYAIGNSNWPESFQVGYSTTSNNINAFTTWGDEINVDHTGWLQYENIFPTGTKCVAIKCTSFNAYYLYLDDFSFEAFNGAYNLAVSEVTATRATLDWAGSQESYTLRYRQSSDPTPSATANHAHPRYMSEWTVVEDVTAPYELTGLEPETYYEWQVQGILADGTTEWSELSSFTTLEAPASVTVGETLYTTYVAPSDVSFPAELTAYIVTEMTETAAVLQEVSAIPAGAAVVVKAEAAGTYYLDAATSTDDMTGNMLKASDGTVQGASNIYALANKSKGIGFYPVASSVTIPAGKAYLEITSKAKAFYGFFEDDATAIDNLNAGVDADEAIYNVAGQRISKKQKGVNIVNGKKILF